jgi:hypothetical protein
MEEGVAGEEGVRPVWSQRRHRQWRA